MQDLRNDAIAALANAIQKIASAHDRDLSAQMLEDVIWLAKESAYASQVMGAGHKDRLQVAADSVRVAYGKEA